MSATVLFAVAACFLAQGAVSHPACGVPPPAWPAPCGPAPAWGPAPPAWSPAPCGPAAPAPRRALGPVQVSLEGLQGGVLSVVSGGPLSPEGLSFSCQNEISGPLGVSGSLPFATALSVNGAVASAGHASVAYSTAPGLAVSGGCGQGLAGPGHAPAPRGPHPPAGPAPPAPRGPHGGPHAGCGCAW